jgi:hypothetical protein
MELDCPRSSYPAKDWPKNRTEQLKHFYDILFAGLKDDDLFAFSDQLSARQLPSGRRQDLCHALFRYFVKFVRGIHARKNQSINWQFFGQFYVNFGRNKLKF